MKEKDMAEYVVQFDDGTYYHHTYYWNDQPWPQKATRSLAKVFGSVDDAIAEVSSDDERRPERATAPPAEAGGAE